jgi:hypothetical protein
MTENAPVSRRRAVVTPPFLLLATLVFWGWQTNLLVLGVVMGVVLESPRFLKIRFDFSPEDFRRLWNFCGLLGLALVLYTFTRNEEGGGVGNLLHGTGRNAMLSSIHAASTIPRWFPMFLFLLVAAQNFSERGAIPLSDVSFFFRRLRGDKNAWNVNVSYLYFAVCLFSASIHVNEGSDTYFWGLSILLAWALWPLRSRRFRLAIWAGAFLLAVILGHLGTRGIGQLEQFAQNYNAQWMAHWLRQRTDATQATTFIGQIGELKLSSEIVIRLQTPSGAPPPTYLHEASYHKYDFQTWRSGGLHNEFRGVLPETNGGSSYNLSPGANDPGRVNIACYLNGWNREVDAAEGLLPLPTGSTRLENIPASVASIETNLTGAVLATGPGLFIFDARYGSTSKLDTPPNTNWDWDIPTNELPALKQVIAEIKITGASDKQKELAVANFFATKFTYSTWQGPDHTHHTNETPLGRFLLQTRSGHCEYFATATVLLLRALKIPARYAVGYYVHEADGDNKYVVRGRDAHAWCLVWNQQEKAWQDFDTTPGTWIARESERASALQGISDFFSWLHFEFSKFLLGQTRLREYILWALVPVMAFLLYQIIFRRGRRRQPQKLSGKNAGAIPWPGLDSEFYELESKLATRGIPRQPGEALSGWLERILAENSLAALRAPLQELLKLHYRHRFDPRGLNAGERKLLAQNVRAVLQSLAEK